MCDACTDPQLCRDTNSCTLVDEMTRIAQENGEYDDFIPCDDCVDPLDCGSWSECYEGKGV